MLSSENHRDNNLNVYCHILTYVSEIRNFIIIVKYTLDNNNTIIYNRNWIFWNVEIMKKKEIIKKNLKLKFEAKFWKIE